MVEQASLPDTHAVTLLRLFAIIPGSTLAEIAGLAGVDPVFLLNDLALMVDRGLLRKGDPRICAYRRQTCSTWHPAM